MNLRRRRPVLALAAAGLIAMTLSACSSSSGSILGISTASPSPVPTASADGSPVAYQGILDQSVGAKGTTGKQPTVAVAKGAAAPSVLATKDLVIGTGATVTATSTIEANYVGVNFTSGKIFDSSWATRTPLSISLDHLIPGWQKGLPGMKVGGVRMLLMPADDAYGSSAPNPSVAGPLIFVVELLKAS